MSSYCNGEACEIEGCVICILRRTHVSTTAQEDRLTRGKRLLDQSTERVKKARITAKRVTLQQQFLEAKERLDECQLMIIRVEEDMDNGPIMLLRARQDNLRRLKDKRQRFLMEVITAEEAILDL